MNDPLQKWMFTYRDIFKILPDILDVWKGSENASPQVF